MKYCRYCKKIYDSGWFHMCPENLYYSSEFVDNENEVEYLNSEIDNLESEYLDMEIDRDYWKNKYESMFK